MLEYNGKNSIADRAKLVLDELALGIQWERPSLILAVYRSEHIKNLVQTILSKSLGESGQSVFHFFVDKFHYDIPVELLDHPKHTNAVFFVSGVRWGGGRGYSNAYRALNMHRETLIEGKVKAIFWLTGIEAKQLTRFSPDFWAFRHLVVEFLDLPLEQHYQPLRSTKGTLHTLYGKTSNESRGWINAAKKLYAQGCIDDAIYNYRMALRLNPNESAIHLQIAEIQLSMGRLQAARRILTKINKTTVHQVGILRELDRLTKAAKSPIYSCGGFIERTTIK
jgi:hypothetical protein